MEQKKYRKQVLNSYSLALIIQILTWFVLYPTAGYNNLTLNIALGAMFGLGIILMFLNKMSWKRIGLGGSEFTKAIIGFLAVNLIIFLLLLLMKSFGGDQPLFRSNYRLDAFVSNWLLTAFGEELVFAGVLFTLITFCFDRKKHWQAVMIVAGLFALWHLPGYLAIGIKMESLNFGIIIDLLLRFISWLFFGFMYSFSGNLWLVVFAHASTDYAILPAVVNQPLIGLIFMGLLLGYALYIGKTNKKPQQSPQATSKFSYGDDQIS